MSGMITVNIYDSKIQVYQSIEIGFADTINIISDMMLLSGLHTPYTNKQQFEINIRNKFHIFREIFRNSEKPMEDICSIIQAGYPGIWCCENIGGEFSLIFDDEQKYDILLHDMKKLGDLVPYQAAAYTYILASVLFMIYIERYGEQNEKKALIDLIIGNVSTRLADKLNLIKNKENAAMYKNYVSNMKSFKEYVAQVHSLSEEEQNAINLNGFWAEKDIFNAELYHDLFSQFPYYSLVKDLSVDSNFLESHLPQEELNNNEPMTLN